MNLGRTVFAQLISFLPDREFRRGVSRYDGDRRWRGFSGWDQFLYMAFAQLTYRESLRDIEACLRSLGAKLYRFMTELEQQLTTALTALSEQYEREQRRQAEQVEALQEQMQRLEEAVKDLKPQLGQTVALAEDLKRQVKRLAADYKQIAEVLRGV